MIGWLAVWRGVGFASVVCGFAGRRWSDFRGPGVLVGSGMFFGRSSVLSSGVFWFLILERGK